MDEAQDTQNEKTIEERLAELPRQLAGLQLELQTPRKLIERDDIIAAVNDADGQWQILQRVFCAALLLCWPSAQRRTGAPRYRGDVREYGGLAYDFLLGHGATPTEILRAGGVAVSLCAASFVAQQQSQEAVRGNGVARGGAPSASSSPSSVTTTSLLARSASSSPSGQGS